MVLNNLFRCLEEGSVHLELTDERSIWRTINIERDRATRRGIVAFRFSAPRYVGHDTSRILDVALQMWITFDLSLPTKHLVNVPLGHLVDLAHRIYAVDSSFRVNPPRYAS